MKIKSILSAALVCAGLSVAAATQASGGHEHGHHGAMHGEKKGHMHDQGKAHGHKKAGAMREVTGQGRVNKVMAKHRMINIKHAPMPEMNWPQMSMNFKAQEQVDLSTLKPGQQVEFTLLVDDNNNYVIKAIRSQ